MPFNTNNFILLFLPAFLLSYFVADAKFKNVVIILYSILFYVIGNYKNPLNILVLLLLTALNYVFCYYIFKFNKSKDKRLKPLTIISIAFNIIVLCIFKSNLFTKNIPLGLSFYIFHFISILVDSYKLSYDSKQFNSVDFISYILYFPKILSGPITRYDYYISQINHKDISKDRCLKGLFYISIGLALKCLLSDNISYIVNQINVYGFDSISFVTAWMGMYSYTMRLYFDFDGYSLMAIGLANVMGMDLPVNFDLPFCSKSISEFWRRWHITLGHFFRDYIYIPLGGNFENKNIFRQSVNLIVVWLVTGLWHGFKVNFILWAMLICSFIILEKVYVNKIYSKCEIVGRVVVNLIMPFAFLIFSIENLNDLSIYISRLFNFSTINNIRDFQVIFNLYGKIFVIGILFMTKYPKAIMNWIEKRRVLMVVVSIVLIVLSIYMFNVLGADTFKYFAF